MVTLQDVNDNAPVVQQRAVFLCRSEPVPVRLDIEDRDSPGNSAPFSVEMLGEHRHRWSIHTNSSESVFLTPRRPLSVGRSSVLLRVSDSGRLHQDSSVEVEVCECQGTVTSCPAPRSDPRLQPLPQIALGLGVVFLLLLLLLLLWILRRRKRSEEDTALLKDPPRDDICYYDDEGGGEDDRDFDVSLLHRGLSEAHEVCSAAVPDQTHPGYRLRPQPDEDIAHFLSENLVAADSDPCAPPYDSLLVFDFEGCGSQADSLSSLDCSDSDQDQDQDQDQDFGPLRLWGPRFVRLAELYTEGMDDDSDTQPGKTEWV